jgi:hypothetical protein
VRTVPNIYIPNLAVKVLQRPLSTLQILQALSAVFIHPFHRNGSQESFDLNICACALAVQGLLHVLQLKLDLLDSLAWGAHADVGCRHDEIDELDGIIVVGSQKNGEDSCIKDQEA